MDSQRYEPINHDGDASPLVSRLTQSKAVKVFDKFQITSKVDKWVDEDMLLSEVFQEVMKKGPFMTKNKGSNMGKLEKS
jgi:hypothetical protein